MKRLITGLLSFVMLLGCSACFNQAGQSPSTGSDSSLAALKSGFSCFDEIRFFEYGNFYKASINTDKQYVTEGDTSGKFSFRGGVPSTFSTYNVWSNTNYFGNADFTRDRRSR